MATPTDTDRRLAMLARVERGELDHSAAAKELGLTPGVWGLWRARQARGQGKKPVAKKATRKNTRGRKADPAETTRRVATLQRVQAGELNSAAAAKDLGIKLEAWSVWKSGDLKQAKPARRGRPAGKATTLAAAATGSLAGVVGQLEGLHRFGEELREREMVESRFPG
ncbi:MAG: hypothetical protein IPN34_17505 [Planctomycetes bacterium]|nr:hypothetical protein [Planctomycetota bacterium]